MKIQDSYGNEIVTIEDWARIYETSQQSHHWKEHRSAYSAADFVLNHGGCKAISKRVSEALGHKLEIEKVIPEHELRFDQYGRGRVHDLGIFGRTEDGKSIFIGVEAKVDESFGASTLDAYLKAKANQIAGVSTKAPDRIEALLAAHFNKPDPSMFDVRYQLLYATVGTLAADADIHVFYVVVFRTPLYDETLGADNFRDYIHFMDQVGAVSCQLPTKEAVCHRLQLEGKELICLYEYFTL